MAPHTQALDRRPYGCVLLTRPQEDSERIAPDFEKLGYQVMISPVLRINSLEVVLPSHDLICLSSKNALPALASVSKKTPIFCVGSYTQRLIRELGFLKVRTAPTAGELYGLLKTQSGQILYLAGTVSALDFSESLSKCLKCICYEAHPVQHLSQSVLQQPIDYIPLYSVRSAQLLHKLLIKNKISLGNIIILALSTAIAESIKEVGFKRVLIASDATHQGLLNLLTRETHYV